ncbi:MAG: carboxypeptidase-like regulatory domain-containing protein [Verrucomicrobia bacterium]|nr:carboxypeptidase-like regulatory domain-containing protein [Verrucomicrobiota bacterium]MBU1910175.1 carboxypeptidase-like regulatory domain-containing protein [Verrucomicrobiota bacterium]
MRISKLMILIMAAVLSFADAYEINGVLISGLVIGKDGAPLAGKNVGLVASSAEVQNNIIFHNTTDITGRFVFTNVAPYKYFIIVGPDYPPTEVVVMTGENITNICISPVMQETFTLNMQLTESSNNEPIGGARLQIAPEATTPIKDLLVFKPDGYMSDADGLVSVPSLYPGQYIVFASIGGETIGSIRATISAQREIQLKLESGNATNVFLLKFWADMPELAVTIPL